MDKQEVFRLFPFSDAILGVKAKEKIAFMRRDAASFSPFGITAAMVTSFETTVTAFQNSVTDVEAISDQMLATDLKDAKAEQVRVAIRAIMVRAESKYTTKSPKYKKFGTEALAQQTDAELLITGRRVVRAGNLFLTDLASNGLTAAMLTALNTLNNEFEVLIVDLQFKIADRDIVQEDRVESANAIYTPLVKYCTTGKNIWETTDVAKYNDYVIYDTVTGEAPVPAPVV